jgi:hypothetical protein
MGYCIVKTYYEKHPGIDGGSIKRVAGHESMNAIDVQSIDGHAKKD